MCAHVCMCLCVMRIEGEGGGSGTDAGQIDGSGKGPILFPLPKVVCEKSYNL